MIPIATTISQKCPIVSENRTTAAAIRTAPNVTIVRISSRRSTQGSSLLIPPLATDSGTSVRPVTNIDWANPTGDRMNWVIVTTEMNIVAARRMPTMFAVRSAR